MIYAAGAALPGMLTSEEAAQGLLYPALERIRAVSVRVARDVVRAAVGDGVARVDDGIGALDDEGLEKWIWGKMYDPFRVEG